MGKVNETQIANILKFMQDRHVFASIERMTYCPVDMEFAMSVIETIGTYRNPKFRIDDENRFVYENMVRWVHGDTEMKCVSPDDSKKVIPGDIAKGIYIAGNTGTGKTWCLDIMSKYTQLLNIGIKIVGERHALTWGGFRADAIIAEYQQTGEYYRFAKQPIIIPPLQVWLARVRKLRNPRVGSTPYWNIAVTVPTKSPLYHQTSRWNTRCSPISTATALHPGCAKCVITLN